MSYLKQNKWLLFYLIHSIYFNFKYLPFKQAIKLPILLYRPHFLRLKGSIKIEGPIKTAMIKLGFYRVPLYSDNGCLFAIDGKLIFRGKAKIGNDSKILVGEKATLIIGDNFNATAGLKLVCNYGITIESNVLIGWETLLLDSDFHKVTNLDPTTIHEGYGKILIGHDSWLANRVTVYKNVVIPAHSIIGAGTTLYRTPSSKEYCLFGANTIVSIKKNGVWYNHEDGQLDH